MAKLKNGNEAPKGNGLQLGQTLREDVPAEFGNGLHLGQWMRDQGGSSGNNGLHLGQLLRKPTPPPPPPTVAISPAALSQAEGDVGVSYFLYTVTRSGDLSGTATVQYAVTGSGEHAADDLDFGGSALPSGTVSFVAGEATKQIAIAVNGDTTFEASEAFTITLANAVGAIIAAGSASGVILNDDPLVGDQGDNTLSGGAGADTILGLGGYDILRGGGGNDTIDTGPGAVRGNQGFQDEGYGEGGDDTLQSGPQPAGLFGGDGDDLLNLRASGYGDGGAGNDTLISVNFASLEGGAGNDSLVGSGYNANGGVGNDTIYGTGTLIGDEGNDLVVGSLGSGAVVGGLGDDTIIGSSNGQPLWNDDLTGADSMDGGGGDDYLFARLLDGPQTVTLSDAGELTVNGTLVGINIDRFRLTGANGPQTLTGGSGGDEFLLAGDYGDDSINGGGGADRVGVTLTEAGDVLTLVASGELTINGRLLGVQVENVDVYGGLGSDTLQGGASSTRLNGDEGDDRLVLGSAGFAAGGEGNDTVIGGAERTDLSGGAGNDLLVGVGVGDNLYGDNGSDTLVSGPGSERIILNNDGAVDRILFAPGSGADTVTSYTHEDIFDLSAYKSAYGSSADQFSDFPISIVGSRYIVHLPGGGSITFDNIWPSSSEFYFG